jgi:hypothetical protein
VENTEDKIFISIASFCDEELVPTLVNALENAAHPERFVFGICFQDHEETIQAFPFLHDPRFKIIHVKPEDSKGCCWARAQIQQLYTDEKYYLQLDSHHRFVKDWDLYCIEWLAQCDSAKPILTGYMIRYEKGEEYEHEQVPYKLKAEKFYDNNKLRLSPDLIDDYLQWNSPLPTCFLSAHFLFTYGEWVTEVPYDPELYFEGEEDTLAVRSYTHGWDLFHPHRAIVYHYYTRSDSPKHHQVHENWHEYNRIALDRMRKLLGIIPNDHLDFGRLGLGKERTLEQYEAVSGIHFRHQTIHGKRREELLPDYPNKGYQYRYMGGYYKCTDPGVWQEFQSEVCLATFQVVDEEKEYLILLDASRNLYIKIDGEHCSFKVLAEGYGNSWTLLYKGYWQETPLDKETEQQIHERIERYGEIVNPGKSIAVATLKTPNIIDWAVFSEVNVKAYCQKQDYSLYNFHHLIAAQEPPHWNKVKVLLHTLPQHDYVMWIDSDAIFTDFDKSIQDIFSQAPDKDLLVCNDIGGWLLNTGVIIAKNTPWTLQTLQELWARPHYPHAMGAEQNQLIQLLTEKDPDRKSWQLFDQKVFNSHPDVHTEGDYILHMMGLSGAERAATFQYWNNKLGIDTI